MKLQTFFKKIGYDITEYEKMNPYMDEWKSWYKGKVPQFQKYYIYNGEKKVSKQRKTMGMAKKICEDFADLLLNEKVLFNIGDEKESKEVNQILDENDFYVLANEGLEKTFYGGTGAFVLSIKDLIYDTNTNIVKATQESRVKIEFVTVDKIVPLTYEGKKITECAFMSNKTINGQKFIYISIHRKNESGNYVIENHLLKLNKAGEISQEIELNDTLKTMDTKGSKPWFSILRPNICNNIDEDSPYGISVFANAIDIMKALDIVFDSMSNEFILGRKRIFVKSDLLKPDLQTGEIKLVFDENEVVFHSMPCESGEEDIKEVDMKLRITEHEQAIQLILDILSSKVGLGDKYYEFRKTGIATATQVISENSDLFRTIKKHEIAIENCLYDLFKSILFILNTFLNANLKEDADISINFDDSIIEDMAEIKKQALIELNAGLIDDIEYYKKVYKMTEKQAKKFKEELKKRSPEEPVKQEENEE